MDPHIRAEIRPHLAACHLALEQPGERLEAPPAVPPARR
jgi:hypothetical protein